MFSRAGRPWSRAIVCDFSHETSTPRWTSVSAAQLPGEPFALLPHGIDPIDLANFVSKTETWDADRVRGLRQMFYDVSF